MIDAAGEQAGIVSIKDAIVMAADAGLELVEIAPNADPPVCRIMDYGKFLYEASKQKQESKKKQKQITIKEVKLRPVTDVGDYDVKLKNMTRFLEEGNKVKVTMRFRGREMAFPELGMEMLKRIAADVEHIAEVEQRAKMEGRQMVMVMVPKRS